MIVTPMTQFDLTGTDAAYLRVARRFKVFVAQQKISFDEPVYVGSIKVWKINADGSKTVLSQDVDGGWKLSDSQDVDALSAAKIRFDSLEPSGYIAVGRFKQTTDTDIVSGKLYFIQSGSTYVYVEQPVVADIASYYEPVWDDGNHYSVLVNSIIMKNNSISKEYTIEVQYQALELDIKRFQRDGLGPEYSPGLMRSVVEAIDELQSFNASVANLSNDNLFTLIDAEEDLTGKLPSNRIEGEVHTIDVPNNKFVVRPCCGSFYPWPEVSSTDPNAPYQLIVEFRGVNTVGNERLVRGRDYEVVGVNQAKTAVSEPVCGVYEFITFKRDLVGTVYLSYQAFGGEVSVADINRLAILVENIKRYCDNAELITQENLPHQSIIRSIIDRIDYLDETVRHYQSQRFGYTTLTNDADKWVSIAFIEKNPWLENAPVNRTDFGEFRVEIPEAHFLADLRLTYDMDADVKLAANLSHSKCGDLDEVGYSYFNTRVVPKFRIVAIGTTEENLNKGLMLQMSMSRATALTCTVIITDRTGAKSPWSLIDTQSEARPGSGITSGDTNTTVHFPNGNTWYSTSGIVSNVVPIIPNGYTIFSGAYNINKIEENTVVVKADAETAAAGTFTKINESGLAINPLLSGNVFEPENITYFEFRVWDRVAQQYRIARSQKLDVQQVTTNNVTSKVLIGDALYFTDDLCVISLQLTKTNSTYTSKLFSRTGTNSLNCNRFVLTRIDILN